MHTPEGYRARSAHDLHTSLLRRSTRALLRSRRARLPLLLVVEDEPTLAAAVAARLTAEGFAVQVAHDGQAALDAAAATPPDLVVLDLMLPRVDGLEVCRRLQAQRPVPVLMLTARGDEADRVIGLGRRRRRLPHQAVRHARARGAGAGPAAPRRARPRAGLGGRRRRAARARPAARRPARRAGCRATATQVHLTPTEFDLLVCLGERRGQVLTREHLLARVWDWPDASGTRAVDSHVKSLRRKLGAELIRTVHGVGYALEAGG